jgi:hypothetical protein
MNKILRFTKLFLLIILFSGIATSKAAPGDTTWVQANNVQLDWYNNFDTSVVFPNGSVTYRKIIMIFTLGQYNCPPGTQYCHQWDYTVTNYVLTDLDTLEISRFITPYATTGAPRFGPTWKQRYNFDVTDYANYLKNTATVRIHYSGYSGGFTANIKFAFIEGVPPRNVLGINKVWAGYFQYGSADSPIDNNVVAKTLTPPAGTDATEFKLGISGHGSDATSQCCEFNTIDAGHDYFLLKDGAQIAQHNIWRNDCGVNHLSPQGGTWIYNRSNWCPGSTVDELRHVINGTAPSTPFSLDLNFESYVNTPSASNTNTGGYDISGQVIYYDSFNKTLDASIEDVVAPTNDENYYRENPAGHYPIIKVKNTGGTVISAIKFQYNVKDSAVSEFTWNGTLNPATETTIRLAPLNTLMNMSLDSITNGLFQFEVKVATVNGVTDADATNNTFKTKFVVAPKWPTKVVIAMKTNNLGVGSVLNAGVSETSWQITDLDGNVYAKRTNCAVSTQYTDTVSFAKDGFYKLTITDTGCDGLWWWPYQGSSVTAGNFTVKKLGNSSNIPMKGYTYTGTYRHDFGCEFKHFFTTSGNITGLEDYNENDVQLSVFPNPANNLLNIQFTGINNANGTISIIDVLGKVVLNEKISSLQTTIDVTKLTSGYYNVIYSDLNSNILQSRLVINK